MAPVDQYNMRGWIVAGAALLLSNCLELEETITIRPDGTGTQALSMKISREMFAALQQQVTIASGGESVAAIAGIFDKKQATAEIAGLDLTLTINLPGEVCKKSENLSVEKQSTQVIARITAASIQAPRDLLALLAPCYVAEFDSRLCTW